MQEVSLKKGMVVGMASGVRKRCWQKKLWEEIGGVAYGAYKATP